MIIETERLLLRPFLESDAADVFQYLNEPAVHCFACMKLNSLEEAKAEVKKRTTETEYYFAIVLKGTGKVIGEIDAYPESVDSHDSPDDDESVLDTFSPCWMLNTTYQGKGYAYEAAHAFLTISFIRKVQDESMRIRKTTMFQVSACAKNLACVKKVYSKNSFLLSTTMPGTLLRKHYTVCYPEKGMDSTITSDLSG